MMPVRYFVIGSLVLLSACTSWPDPGISEDLARARKAQVGAVAYTLDIKLKPLDATFHGTAHIAFELKDTTQRLVLDYRGRDVGVITLEQTELTTDQWEWRDGHIVFDASLFKVGRNVLHIPFESAVGEAGEGLIRTVDVRDGNPYIYSLNVPADGHSVFPCFDQPNLKATFASAITVPRQWLAISHTHESGFRDDDTDDTRTWHFPPSAPISTYLYAFAAGPFMEYRSSTTGRPMRFFCRAGAGTRASAQAGDLFRLHGEALKFFENYFGIPYPFSKFDFIAMPDFPFNGMEHPGCIFYRENSVLFRIEPTRLRELGRADLIAHETAHMWFGDLVTMPWFDDVWLKEGFATFMAHKAVSAANPGAARDAEFFLRNYTGALRSDTTRGAQAMRRSLSNLKDAKSNYGPIIYRKGPAVLRQLEFAIGKEAFQKGVRLFLTRNPYACGDWDAFRECFEEAAGGISLQDWSDKWIEGAGAPVVIGHEVETPEVGVKAIQLTQAPSFGEGERTWPVSTSAAIYDKTGLLAELPAISNGSDITLKFPLHTDAFFFPNHGCRAYGLFLMDPISRARAMATFPSISDNLLRTQIWESLWHDVMRGNLSPSAYMEFSLRHVGRETNLRLLRLIFGHQVTIVDDFLLSKESAKWGKVLEATLLEAANRMDQSRDYRYIAWQTFMRGASTASGREYLALRCADKEKAPGQLPMTRWERWSILTRLSALGDTRVPNLIKQLESIRLGDADEVRRRRFLVDCAWPDAKSKAKLFDRFLNDDSLPERWVQNGASAFFQSNQSDLIAQYIRPAIEKLDWIKDNRKIFFLADWINSVVGSVTQMEDAEWIQSYVDRSTTQPDIAKKVLVPLDHTLNRLRVLKSQSKD